MTLRASLGHLELRRFSLERAAAEFGAASQLARSFGTTSLEALILNNLGIVHNQRNDFRKAKRCFRRAEGLLERSGERRAVIQIACNLASLAAKTGDANGARDRLEQAAHLLAHYPGTRLEFLVGLSRGLVAYFLGDVQTAIEAFQAMVPAGRKLGDSQFVTYAKIYLVLTPSF